MSNDDQPLTLSPRARLDFTFIDFIEKIRNFREGEVRNTFAKIPLFLVWGWVHIWLVVSSLFVDPEGYQRRLASSAMPRSLARRAQQAA